jgi:hypothetical protein
MRWYRYAMFVVSVCIAVALHLFLFYIAPQVILQQKPQASANTPPKPIRIALRPASAAQAPQAAPSRVLATRPGTVSDLVKPTEEKLEPGGALLTGFQPMPDVAKRVGADAITREHALAPAPDVARNADARIIEIAAEDARSQLNVARRLVRPSPDRLLQDGEMPTLRVAGADGPMALDLGTLGRSLLSEPAQPTDPAGPARPPVEAAAAAAPVPPLPSVQISRAPAAQAAEELRKESAFTFLDDMLDLRLDVYTPDPAQPGYFRLRILPRADVQMTPLRKTVTFVIDASKSIPQHKLRAVCKGVTASLALLRPEDAFNVIIFRDTSQPLRPTPEPATDALKAEAAKLLADLEAKGETNVYQALEPLMQLAPQPGYPGQIILLTDGHPTAGIQDGRTLINGLTASNALRNTVFPYAGGNNVNRPLLDLLAYRNRGRSLISDDLDDIEKDLPAFVKSLNDPLLVNCEAGFVNLDAGAVFPDNLTDLYAAQPIVLYGRYDPAKQDRFLVRLTGRAGDTPKEVVFETLFKDAQSADASVAQGWAFEKAYYLIGEISRQGETPELVAELRALSQQYGIKTSYD